MDTGQVRLGTAVVLVTVLTVYCSYSYLHMSAAGVSLLPAGGGGAPCCQGPGGGRLVLGQGGTGPQIYRVFI